MKKLTKLLIIILFAFNVNADAQITLKHSYPGMATPNFQWVYLKHDGFKYFFMHSDTLSFYNEDYSFFRDAIFPAWMDTNYFNIGWISEGLFDKDSTHIDYLIWYTSTCGCQRDNYIIYKDDGTVVFSEDSALVNWTQTIPFGTPIYYPIVVNDSGTFMIVYKETGNFPAEIYKLPGSLPCVPGCGGNNPASMPEIGNKPSGNMEIYPNPVSNYSNAYYTLPPGTDKGELVMYDVAGREVKRYTVTRQFDHLRLSTSDVKAGTYFYQLTANGNNISSKKIIVVK